MAKYVAQKYTDFLPFVGEIQMRRGVKSYERL